MSRQAIIDFASTLVGSHYLWGSTGDTPERDNGAWYETSSVAIAPASTDPNTPAIFAAQCKRSGFYVCAGRFEKIYGGRYATSIDPDLQGYLTDLKNLYPSIWEPFHLIYSPRVMHGANIGVNDGRIAWGEDCRGKRHFDCVSFVNYVLSATTKTSWGFDILQYAAEPAKFVTSIAVTEAPVAGDIILKGHGHIALLCADNHVIQAEQHDTGVHADAVYNSGSWTQRLRVLDSFIK
jgi:cell wall-associated NlpC family hydrolase